jgi:large subunit ribosomal protein L11
MAQKIRATVTLQLPAGGATPAPPVGTALGPHGINIVVLKTPPAADMIRKAAGIEKGAGDHKAGNVGKITRAQVEEIASKKMADLNAPTIEAACKMIEGSAKSMGVEVVA